LNGAFSSTHLLLGRVIRPHGLDGVLRVRSFAEADESFLQAGSVFLKAGDNEPREFPVVSVRPHNKGVLLALEGVDSIEEAETFRNADVYVRRDALNRDHEDEFFWFELIGLDVHLESGERIGTLAQIIPTAGHDVYVVRSGPREFMIPGTREVVREIDLDGNRMTIRHMEGLLDLDEG